MPHGPCNCAHKQIALAETKKKWKKQEYLKQMNENNNILKMEKKKRQKRALDSLALCKKYITKILLKDEPTLKPTASLTLQNNLLKSKNQAINCKQYLPFLFVRVLSVLLLLLIISSGVLIIFYSKEWYPVLI